MTELSSPHWYCLDLGDAMLATPRLDELCTAFTLALTSGQHRGGLFVRHESEGQLHCAVKVYFSPGVATVAKRLGAVRCPPPRNSGLSLLVGGPEVWAEVAND